VTISHPSFILNTCKGNQETMVDVGDEREERERRNGRFEIGVLHSTGDGISSQRQQKKSKLAVGLLHAPASQHGS